MTAEEIKNIVKQVDLADNKKINYTEFLAATIDTSKFLTETRLEAIFQ
jgi:Ca2+-binding EF-hand superfamily protein